MSYKTDAKKLENLERTRYTDVFLKLGEKMFSECTIPTVADFASIEKPESLEKIRGFTDFTGNHDDIMTSVQRREANYTEEESSNFMKSVIASNVTDITQSGYFYKKLISSCDNMRITQKDCRSGGTLIQLPVDELTYNYKLKFRYIKEIKTATESYDEFVKLTSDYEKIHVRTFLDCKTDPDHRCFCARCAGLFKRSQQDYFVPEDIGIYSTLMITESATQSSLDSMNKGRTEKINSIVEQRLNPRKFPDYRSVKEKINAIIDQIGYIGVLSRYFEIALLSRFYRRPDGSFEPSSLQTSFVKQNDALGTFIYKPTRENFRKLFGRSIEAKSMKSKIMFDVYD